MIVVAGESLVDLLVEEQRQTVAARLGGAPFNVARGLARLGVPCAFLGSISEDGFGRMLRQALAEDGVDLACIVTSSLPTTLAVAEIAEGSAGYAFHAHGTAAPALTTADVAKVAPSRIDALHVGALGLVLEPMALALDGLVADVENETLVMVDPNCRPDAIPEPRSYRERLARIVRRADVVKVSTEDLEYLEPGRPAALSARSMLGGRTRCVLVTDGARPVRVLAGDDEFLIEAQPAAVVDTVGAGDAFCAGFLAWWSRHGHPAHALADARLVGPAVSFAAMVAASTCGRQGADPPRLQEIDPLWRMPVAPATGSAD